MGYLERRIERLEDCLDFSMQRNGSAFNHMEMLILRILIYAKEL